MRNGFHGRICRVKVLKNWKFWLGLAISLIFLYLALRGLRLADLVDVLGRANYWWLLPGVAVYFVAVWVRAWRWRYLLLPIKEIPTRRLFPTTVIGYLGNNIFPARAGELLRIVVKHNEGNYTVDPATFERMQANDQIIVHRRW